jgi:hypothetical protein
MTDDKSQKSKRKNTRGKPPIVLTAEHLRQAEELSGYGLSMAQIAAVLGIGERTLYEKAANDPAISAALTRGKAKAAAIVGKALFLRAKDGDVKAIQWWEMTRDGRSAKVATEVSGPDKGPVRVEITEARAKLAQLIERQKANDDPAQ